MSQVIESMIPGMKMRNPRQMQKMMKQMGMQELPVKEIILVMDDKKLVIKEPQVMKMNVMGQETYQITGNAEEFEEEETFEAVTGEDVSLIVEQTGVSKEKAEEVLRECDGDLAEAIMKLQG